MPLNVAVQMDPIAGITILNDSSIALMLEAQARGHALYYYTPYDLSLQDGAVTARASHIKVRDVQGEHYTLGPPQPVNLAEMDIVLMRQDPPFDMAYITATYLLERLKPHTLVVNDPTAVRDGPEKLMVFDFPQFMPPTLISRNRSDIDAFRRAHGAVVMKPLYGNAGASVFIVEPDDPNFVALYELFFQTFKEPWVTQRFLPQVRAGDKRIILMDGKPGAAMNRVPAANTIRSNTALGGTGILAELTLREEEICEALGPVLRARGLLFAGIDVIGGNLTEINVTSPTGPRYIHRLGGPDLYPVLWDAMERRQCEQKSSLSP